MHRSQSSGGVRTCPAACMLCGHIIRIDYTYFYVHWGWDSHWFRCSLFRLCEHPKCQEMSRNFLTFHDISWHFLTPQQKILKIYFSGVNIYFWLQQSFLSYHKKSWEAYNNKFPVLNVPVSHILFTCSGTGIFDISWHFLTFHDISWHFVTPHGIPMLPRGGRHPGRQKFM